MTKATTATATDYSLARRHKDKSSQGFSIQWDIVVDDQPNSGVVLDALINGDMGQYVYLIGYKIDGVRHAIQIGEFFDVLKYQEQASDALKAMNAIRQALEKVMEVNPMLLRKY